MSAIEPGYLNFLTDMARDASVFEKFGQVGKDVEKFKYGEVFGTQDARAENLVEFAKYTNDNELDNVVKEIVTLVQEQRLELLTEVLQLIKRGASETIIEERQRQEAAKLSKRQTL